MAGPGTVTPIRYDLAQFAVVTQVVNATQFISSGLASFDSGTFVGFSVWVLYKADKTATAPKGDAPAAVASFLGADTPYPNTPGTVNHAAFTASLAVGDGVLILHPAIANAVLPPTINVVSASVVANWNAAAQDLVTIGGAGLNRKLHALNVFIGNLAGNITIRAYVLVNGVERQIFPVPSNDTFSITAVPPDPPAIPVVNATVGLYGPMRITCQSDLVADNGLAITYTYMLENS